MDWTLFWKEFLDNNKLNNTVREIDSLSSISMEDICHKIYEKYNVNELESVREKLIHEVEKFPGVHLNTSRVKNIDSILRKVITKRYDWMFDPNSRYNKLSEENFDEIITDLIGIRFILSYRGNWKEVHKAIVTRFPFLDDVDYSSGILVPLHNDFEFIAEQPHAYYAYGDDISIYEDECVKPILKESGYRSVHYIVCFRGTYVEIQVRTIYDEAWSDCDHNYVYKHEENTSHAALSELSDILCQYTNTCNELTELMQEIFNGSNVVEKDKKFWTSEDINMRIKDLLMKYSTAQKKLIQFSENVCVKGENKDG